MKRVLSIVLFLVTAFFSYAQEFTWKSVNNQGMGCYIVQAETKNDTRMMKILKN